MQRIRPDRAKHRYSIELLVNLFGDIEIKALRGDLLGYVLVCDNVGREAGNQVNPIASNLYGSIIAGNVLLLKRRSLETPPAVRTITLDHRLPRQESRAKPGAIRGGYRRVTG